MRTIRTFRGLLAGLLVLGIGWPLSSQEKKDSPEVPSKQVELKGQAPVDNPNAQPGQPQNTFKDVGTKLEEVPPAKVDIKPIALQAGKDKSASYQGELTNDDARYQGKKICKVLTFSMEAGKTYRIDHSSEKFDAYLYLEEPAGKVVAQNDDNGESLDSRIVYKAEKNGDYRIVATSLGGSATGNFKLTVRLASEIEIKQASLQKKMERLFNGNAADRKETVQEVAKYLEERGKAISPLDVGLAFQMSQILEDAREEKAAAAACLQFAKSIGKSDDAKAAESAKLFQGVAKRLTLVGNTMEVKAKTLDGKDFDLSKLKGKVVLVDFWATWCGPCVAEIPHLKKMHTKYHKQGFEIIGISLDDAPDSVKQFIAKEDLPWACIFSGMGKEGAGLTEQYGVISIPLAILVGRDGRVVSLNARGPELTRLLEEMIDEKKK